MRVAALLATGLALLAGCGGGRGDGSETTDAADVNATPTADPATPTTPEREVELPGQPGAVGIGRKYVWVGTEGGLVRVDPERDAVVSEPAELRNGRPRAVVVNGGTVWATSSDGGDDNVLTRFDEKTGKAIGEPIALPYADGMGGEGGDLWLIDEGKYVAHRDARTGRLIGRTKLPFEANDVVVEGGVAWAKSDEAGVQRVNSRSGRVIGKPIALVPPFIDIATGEGAVWIAPDAKTQSEPRPVFRLNTRSGRATEKIQLDGPAKAIAAGEGFVWVATLDSMLHKFDSRTGREAGPPTDLGLISVTFMAAGHGAVWLSDIDQPKLTAVEP